MKRQPHDVHRVQEEVKLPLLNRLASGAIAKGNCVTNDSRIEGQSESAEVKEASKKMLIKERRKLKRSKGDVEEPHVGG